MTEKKVSTSTQPDSSLAIASMVLGVVSLTGPGLFLGIPAIVLAIIALKKNAAGRGLSIAGLVTGIVSTVFSLLFIAFLVIMMIVSANTQNTDKPYEHGPSDNRQYYDSRT
ncbi:DUF4190 domain-containing protein [Streptomyces caniscabiei]|uniref:DUF4190 domain-containing protein n=1 Tax=Streptomyces caniscabiei TaxID=2746961 RepID=UPI0029A406A7|nr:DUF4190 domain-containing protein [Streptomyces caniscabiei]MDX2776370.1 DUF4190 domain-containing protein [Streptomyces caniscabiei]